MKKNKILIGFMEKYHFTQKDFAKFCGISVSTMRKFLNNDWGSCRPSIAYKICKATGFKSHDIMALPRPKD